MGYIELMSRVLSAISADATVICCGGSSAKFVKFSDNFGRKTGVQYPLTLLLRSQESFERLLHKPSFSLMGRIDMGSMLRTFLLRLSGLLHERWEHSTQFFRRVRIRTNFLLSPWEYIFGMIFSCFVGLGKWKIRIVYCVSFGAGDYLSLASDCCIYW